MGREAPKPGHQAVEGYMAQRAGNILLPPKPRRFVPLTPVRTPTVRVFESITPVPTPAAGGFESITPVLTPVFEAFESTSERQERGEGEAAAVLKHILTTIVEHVLEVAIHLHGLGVALKAMELVVTICRMAAGQEGRCQTAELLW
jgi:hypothetical protein